ncbi:MAG: glycosyltransferase [Arachidicoccus sp.]|nr:glycosyltransferase [Arachidicoccus sp.]
MKRIIFTLTNDLTYDQRMSKICNSLAQNGFDVLLVGFKKKSSVSLSKKIYRQKRLSLFFERGPLFFIEATARLFFFLLFSKSDIICADDLDTALPVLFASALRNKKRVFDAHELFCDMHDVVTRPRIRIIWKKIERFVQPKFPVGYSANADYAAQYKKMYGVNYFTIVNCPRLVDTDIFNKKKENLLLYQGAVERGRGFEQLIPAIKNMNVQLLVCGDGKYMDELKQLAINENVLHKIIFAGYIVPEKLPEYNHEAYIGMNVNDGFGASFYYSLTNRFFDYMHAGIPQIANNNPQNKLINDQYEIAILVDEITVEAVQSAIIKLLTDKDLHARLQQNCFQARQIYNWQNEEKKLIEFYSKL